MAEWIQIAIALSVAFGGLAVWLVKIGGGIARIEMKLDRVVDDFKEEKQEVKDRFLHARRGRDRIDQNADLLSGRIDENSRQLLVMAARPIPTPEPQYQPRPVSDQ